MFRTLYTGALGMKTISTGMQVVSNNIANVNTVGFKRCMMDYEDTVSQWAGIGNSFITSVNQVGVGSVCSDIRTLHLQEAFESSNTVTDMAINGKGFFGVTDGKNTYYTRAGNFRFTKEGKLVDPNQNQLIGRPIVNGVEGAPQPIALDYSEKGVGFMPPRATTSILNIMNIGVTTNNYDDPVSPCFAMLSNYDATQPSILGNAGYTQPIQVYDSNGVMRVINMAVDSVQSVNGQKIYEYVLYANPDPAPDPAEDDHELAANGSGLLMAGTLTFDSSGQLVNMSAFVPPAEGDAADLSIWTQAPLSESGVPQFTTQFEGAPAAQTIAFDLGLSGSGWADGATNPAEVGTSPFNNLPGLSDAVRSARVTTGYSGSSSSLNLHQDGYASGSLMNLEIKEDGIIRGRYSNGQSEDIFRMSLFRFISQDGLRREGSNLYSATAESGAAEEGVPGTENFGTVHGNAIEMSNVDLAREFVHMIMTQRGFQANSKSMMTADSMLQKAMELKR